MRLRAALPAVFALLLAGCSPARELYQDRLYVFGTLVDVTLWDVTEQQGRAAVADLAREFQAEHVEWHAWRPGPLVELNAALARGEAARATPHLVRLIELSQRLSRQSDGLFDPAIGGLVRLWGFHSDDPLTGKAPPSREAIAAWVAQRPSMEDLTIEGDLVRSRNPAVQLDFGAIAKGYAVDLAVARLHAMGIHDAIVNAGGGMTAIGRRENRPWRVGVRHPQGQGVIAALELADHEAVHTSGNYERYNEHEGIRYGHIIDPRTGYPGHEIVSATVIHPDGAVADAAATALVLAGVKDWERIARQMGVTLAMLVDESGTVHMPPAMAARVHFAGDAPPPVKLGAPL
ncbi:MAG: FAD:protein FMN transferase [Gammaproteobacteria bacterium]|jgi:thiamine biosynthesis lipoprotein|nr:FAD:protein FMN transferase [Gammaproteobacteria bacterium]